jgi:hypothetical protein
MSVAVVSSLGFRGPFICWQSLPESSSSLERATRLLATFQSANNPLGPYDSL